MQNEWYLRDCGDELCTLQNRETGELATIHFDELQAAGGDHASASSKNHR